MTCRCSCCEKTGACCDGESCSQQTCSDCNDLGGVFQGVGTDCTGVGEDECPCDPPASPPKCEKCVDGETQRFCSEADCCVDGRCEDCPPPTCPTEPCDSDKCCTDGYCVTCPPPTCPADPCTGETCCVDGQCIPCPEPTCPTEPCTGDLCCVDGYCVPCPEYDCDPECDEGDCCVDGVCEPCEECDPGDCPSGQCCVNGVCTDCPEPCSPGDCGEGYCCVDGYCLPCPPPPDDPCSPGDCGPGLCCIDGYCLPCPPEECPDPACPSGECCIDGYCVNPCGPGEYCCDGVCQEEPCEEECSGPCGCTNPNAPNYDPEAVCDDGSCETCCNQGLCVTDDDDAGANCNPVGGASKAGHSGTCCDAFCLTALDCSYSFDSSFSPDQFCPGTEPFVYSDCYDCDNPLP